MRVRIKLKDTTKEGIAKLRKQLADAKDAHVKVGIMDSGKERTEGEAYRNVDIALAHEFGNEVVPPRPFIKPPVEKNADKNIQILGKLMQKNIPVMQALGIVGARMAAEIKKYVTVGNNIKPALSEYTIAKKGSSRPLVDTGQMINSVTWIVSKKEEGEK